MDFVALYVREVTLPLALGLAVWGGAAAIVTQASGLKGLTIFLVLTALGCLIIAGLAFEYAARPRHANRGAPMIFMGIGTMAGSWAMLNIIFVIAARILGRARAPLGTTE